MTAKTTSPADYYAGGFRKMIGGVPCKVFARRLPDGRYVRAKDSPWYDARYDDPKHGMSRLDERCSVTPEMAFDVADDVEAPAVEMVAPVAMVEVLDWSEVVDMPAPIAPPTIAADPVEVSPPAADYAQLAAPINAAAALAEAALAAGADHDSAFRVFVGASIGTTADGWARTQGRQRDRKARNRGKVVVGVHMVDRLREAFGYVYRDAPCFVAAAPIDPAPAIPVDPAPLAPVEPASPIPAVEVPAAPVSPAGDDLAAVAADLAALAARVAALQPAAPVADTRRAARLRAARAYLRLRQERALLRSALATVNGMNAALEARAVRAEDAARGAAADRNRLAAKRGRTAARLAYTRVALTISDRVADAASARVLTLSEQLAAVQADLARLQPLASALSALMPTAPAAQPAPVLVSSNGRDILRAAA